MVSWLQLVGVVLAILVGLWLASHLVRLLASWLHCVASLVLGILGLVILYYAVQYLMRAFAR
ncbi:MAG: hypothetical protein ABSF61_13115 [Anaerolineales bacterium]|jgi:putative Mn2+ efflux pump MntP